MEHLKPHFSIAAYETLGAEWCDEIAAKFQSQYEANGRRVMQEQTAQGQVSGLVKPDGLHIWLVSESSED